MLCSCMSAESNSKNSSRRPLGAGPLSSSFDSVLMRVRLSPPPRPRFGTGLTHRALRFQPTKIHMRPRACSTRPKRVRNTLKISVFKSQHFQSYAHSFAASHAFSVLSKNLAGRTCKPAPQPHVFSLHYKRVRNSLNQMTFKSLNYAEHAHSFRASLVFSTLSQKAPGNISPISSHQGDSHDSQIH